MHFPSDHSEGAGGIANTTRLRKRFCKICHLIEVSASIAEIIAELIFFFGLKSVSVIEINWNSRKNLRLQ